MNPYEILMRGTAQFTGMIPGVNMSMPLNVRSDYIPGALATSNRGSLFPPGPSSMATMGNQGGALVPTNRGGLATMANQGAVYGGPVNRVSVVDVTPGPRSLTGAARGAAQGTRSLPGAVRGAAPALKGLGKALGPIGAAVDFYDTAKGLTDSLGRGEGYAAIPGLVQRFVGNNNEDNKVRGRSGAARAQRQSAPVQQPGAAGQYGPPTPTNEPRRGVFTIDGFNPDLTIDQYREQVIPSRKNLEDRAYQQEVSRVAQQDDPYFRSGAPMLNYSADEGMMINRSLYGDMLTPNTPNPLMAGLTYDQTNPTMQGKNYNMENPVGVQQSSAQALSDYYRNGMIEQQTAGMGSEPGLESVLSPEDRSMYLEQLRNFRPGGPGYGR